VIDLQTDERESFAAVSLSARHARPVNSDVKVHYFDEDGLGAFLEASIVLPCESRHMFDCLHSPYLVMQL
jgi:hypothetical protein